ncbi:synaptobrevin homolog YKT6 isoform X1 [Camelus dromedarius]|uniref:synaptobrevin homolog YKT6 isoform X1 n=1 Tax=Camelus dromedarius TaxID=9838 RepID=UPI001263DF77|nr:synaptobrevin homolog YKT6 isoform X1 [Camelus dromedarius]
MKLYSLSVLYKGDPKVVLLKAAYDVSSFSFFQRSSVQEFMTFTSQLIVERSAKGSRASVKEQEYLCHVYVRNDSLAGVVVADNEYPSRVAFSLLEKVLDDFSKQVDRIDWPVGSPATIEYTGLDTHLSRYQNPREADPMTKVQAELDETKIILHNTMESLLERGEKLDDLVSKSEVLGIQSKAFYKTSRYTAFPERFSHSQMEYFTEQWARRVYQVHPHAFAFRPGSKTRAVQSCDGSRRKPLRWSVTVIHVSSAAPRKRSCRGTTRMGTDAQFSPWSSREEPKGGGRDLGVGNVQIHMSSNF